MAQLNCGEDYRVVYRRGASALAIGQTAMQVRWSRVRDDISTATITHGIGGIDCCDQLADLEPWADDVAIYRDGGLVWCGPVSRVEYQPDQVTVDAFDVLGWLTRRLIHTDQVHVGVDLSDIFAAYWNDAMLPSPIPALLDLDPCGVVGDRTVLAAEYRNAWDVTRELLDTGLDICALGQRIIGGGLDVGFITMTDQNFSGPIGLIKDGGQYANRAVVKAESGVVGIAAISPSDPYPLVEIVTEDAQVQDVASATAAAQTRIDYSQTVPRRVDTPEGVSLILDETVTIDKLVPGLLVQLTTTALCYDRTEAYSLQRVEVDVGETEDVRVTLQPLGTQSAA